jgi:rfaE bifunctional protein nucleotidyltransferase chain/domain
MSELKSSKQIEFNHCNQIADSVRKENKTIVFTNGCFDILHVGHAHYLQQAKSHGDYLWIGLNSDTSVRQLKGAQRPVNSQEARLFLLASLACVDFITIFDESTPISLISTIKPDIHIKGGDYQREMLPEYPIIKEYGGQVVIKPFLKGYSTSTILDKIQSL